MLCSDSVPSCPGVEEDAMQVLSEMEVYWQRQFNQNYTRSLDHRSFYFKVVDKKLLGMRYIIQEIKDAAESTQQHPEAALSVHTSAPKDIKLRPHLFLEMPDLCAPLFLFLSAALEGRSCIVSHILGVWLRGVFAAGNRGIKMEEFAL